MKSAVEDVAAAAMPMRESSAGTSNASHPFMLDLVG
jgi:hypothetical protein